MRIKFTCAHANEGKTDGHVGEAVIYTPEYPDMQRHTDGLAELHRDVFNDLVSKALHNSGELCNAIEEDRATGALVWRVYVRGLFCAVACTPNRSSVFWLAARSASSSTRARVSRIRQPTHTTTGTTTKSQTAKTKSRKGS